MIFTHFTDQFYANQTRVRCHNIGLQSDLRVEFFSDSSHPRIYLSESCQLLIVGITSIDHWKMHFVSAFLLAYCLIGVFIKEKVCTVLFVKLNF